MRPVLKFIHGAFIFLIVFSLDAWASVVSCGGMRRPSDPLQPAFGDSLKGVPVRHIITEQEIGLEMEPIRMKGILSYIIGFIYGGVTTSGLLCIVRPSPHEEGVGGALVIGICICGPWFGFKNLRNTLHSYRSDAIERLQARWLHQAACEKVEQDAPQEEE